MVVVTVYGHIWMAVELDINSLTRVEKGETGFYTAVETDSSIKHASAQS